MQLNLPEKEEMNMDLWNIWFNLMTYEDGHNNVSRTLLLRLSKEL